MPPNEPGRAFPLRFRSGQPLTADDLNRMIDARLQQIVGKEGIQVRAFGDRITIGLTEKGHHRQMNAREVRTDTSEFDDNLSSTDTTVQKALETIDEFNLGGGSQEVPEYQGDLDGNGASMDYTGGRTKFTWDITKEGGDYDAEPGIDITVSAWVKVYNWDTDHEHAWCWCNIFLFPTGDSANPWGAYVNGHAHYIEIYDGDVGGQFNEMNHDAVYGNVLQSAEDSWMTLFQTGNVIYLLRVKVNSADQDVEIELTFDGIDGSDTGGSVDGMAVMKRRGFP